MAHPAPQSTFYLDPPPLYDTIVRNTPTQVYYDDVQQPAHAKDWKSPNPPNLNNQLSLQPPPTQAPLSRPTSPPPPALSTNGKLPLPCVIPQKTKAFKGAFHSPFVRAWIPELEAHDITQADFLSFLDGLNECFVANPVFVGTSVAGSVMQMVYGVPPVQWAGMGLTVASGVASAGTSYMRTRAYVKEMNQDFFHPVGLHCNILTTKKMMAKVGCEEDRLRLEPVISAPETLQNTSLPETEYCSLSERQQMRRIEALKGHVMPLDFNVPAAVAPDNLLKKMGASQAQRMARKQDKKAEKRMSEAMKDKDKDGRKAEKEQRKLDKQLGKMQKELDKLQKEFERDIARETSEKKREKLVKEFEKEKRKLVKETEKEERKGSKKVNEEWEKADGKVNKEHKEEEKRANGVRWIVISTWTAEGDETDGDDTVVDDVSSSEDGEREDMTRNST